MEERPRPEVSHRMEPASVRTKVPSFLSDLGKATLRGIWKCPRCGTYNSTRGLIRKSKTCGTIFHYSTRKQPSVDAVKIITGLDFQVYSVRQRDRGPDYRCFVELAVSETAIQTVDRTIITQPPAMEWGKELERKVLLLTRCNTTKLGKVSRFSLEDFVDKSTGLPSRGLGADPLAVELVMLEVAEERTRAGSSGSSASSSSGSSASSSGRASSSSASSSGSASSSSGSSAKVVSSRSSAISGSASSGSAISGSASSSGRAGSSSSSGMVQVQGAMTPARLLILLLVLLQAHDAWAAPWRVPGLAGPADDGHPTSLPDLVREPQGDPTDVAGGDGYPASRLGSRADAQGDGMGPQRAKLKAEKRRSSQRSSEVFKELLKELDKAAHGGYISLLTTRLGKPRF
ncbi:uncharacterized protein FN964_014872 [Alca torda]